MTAKLDDALHPCNVMMANDGCVSMCSSKQLCELGCSIVPDVQYKHADSDEFIVFYIYDGKPQCVAVRRNEVMCAAFLATATFEISNAQLREHVYSAADADSIVIVLIDPATADRQCDLSSVLDLVSA